MDKSKRGIGQYLLQAAKKRVGVVLAKKAAEIPLTGNAVSRRDFLKRTGLRAASFAVLGEAVIAHIAGPSGAGKTTLLNKIQKKYPNVVTKDLDDIGYETAKHLGHEYFNVPNLPASELKNYQSEFAQRIRSFVKDNEKNKVVFAGIRDDESGDKNLLQNKHAIRLKTGPLRSAWRQARRTSKNFVVDGGENTVRARAGEFLHQLKQIPTYYSNNKKDIQNLDADGYRKMSSRQIMKLIGRELNAD